MFTFAEIFDQILKDEFFFLQLLGLSSIAIAMPEDGRA